MSYVRVGILGTIAGGEVWSVNPTFDPTLEFPGPPDQTALDSAAQAIANLSPGADLLLMLSPQLTITGARVEVRDDTTDALLGLSIASRTTPLVGTGTLRMPPQAALVISLRTNTPGARGRGRLYWPCPAAAVGTDFRVAAGLPASLLAGAKTYFQAMESALATAFPTIGFDLAVRSKAAGATPHVVRLQMGNVIDTQRRRRDSLVEAYTTLAM